MRIISQDKTIDIPYERSVLTIEEVNEHYIKIFAYLGVKYFRLGIYKTLDDAKTVLRAVVAHKIAEKAYYELPQSDEDLGYAYRVM